MKRKNIVHYVTRQYMWQNKKRTFTTLVGIIFMVLLMTCVFVGRETGLAYLEDVASLKEGKWHGILYDVTEKEVEQVKALSYVSETEKSVHLGNTDFTASANKARPYLTVKAYGEKNFSWMNIKLTEGRLPQNEHEIVINEKAKEDGSHIAIGDTISARYFERTITGINKDVAMTYFPLEQIQVEYGKTVTVPQNFPYYEKNTSFIEKKKNNGKTGEYRVVGFIEQPFFELDSSAGYTALTEVEKAGIEKGASRSLSFRLDLKHLPKNYREELGKIAGEHKIEWNNFYLVFSANSDDQTINTMAITMTIFFTVLIMLASVILIYNVVQLSFQERSRYLGMLSSVGATARQKRSSIYYEAFSLLAAALPMGVIGGIGVVKLGMSMLKPFLRKMMGLEHIVADTSVMLQCSVETIIVVLLVSAVTVLVSAFLPARKIAKIGPIECIRGNLDTKEKGYQINVKGIWHFGAEGMLAQNEVRRHKKKSRSIRMAAVIFMVILMVTTSGANIVKKVVEDKMLHDVDCYTHLPDGEVELSFYSNEKEEIQKFGALKDEIKQSLGTERIREWYSDMFTLELEMESFSNEYIDAYHDIFNQYYHKTLTDKEFQEKLQQYNISVCVLSVDDDTLKAIAKNTGSDIEKLLDPMLCLQL